MAATVGDGVRVGFGLMLAVALVFGVLPTVCCGVALLPGYAIEAAE